MWPERVDRPLQVLPSFSAEAPVPLLCTLPCHLHWSQCLGTVTVGQNHPLLLQTAGVRYCISVIKENEMCMFTRSLCTERFPIFSSYKHCLSKREWASCLPTMLWGGTWEVLSFCVWPLASEATHSPCPELIGSSCPWRQSPGLPRH